MSRRLLRPALLGMTIIGIAALFLRSGPGAGLDRALDLPASGRLPELMQRVRSFNRVVTRGGKRLLEVSAQEASYFRGDRAVAVVEPRIAFYDEGQPVGSLQGNTGKLYLDGNELRSVEMDGGVRLKLEQFTLSSPAVAGNQIFIRAGPYLYCLAKKIIPANFVTTSSRVEILNARTSSLEFQFFSAVFGSKFLAKVRGDGVETRGWQGHR